MSTPAPDAVKRLVDLSACGHAQAGRFDQNRKVFLSGDYKEERLRAEFLKHPTSDWRHTRVAIMRGDNMSSRLSVLLVAVGIMLASIACRAPASRGPKVISMEKKVELGQAESVQVSVAIAIGQLTISGGAEGAVDARFDYVVPDWKPGVTYEVEEGLGRLTIKQPSSAARVQAKDVHYDWNLRLPGKVPTDLAIEMGTGKIKLDTRGVKLHHLKVAVGAGEGSIDLSDATTDLTAKVEAGLGKLLLVVPTSIGVRVKVDGIGRVHAPDLTRDDTILTNAAWGKSKSSIQVDIAGIGEVEIKTASRQGI
jgi:hypothetical protein